MSSSAGADGSTLKEKKSKKRHRNRDEQHDGERKHKRSKSTATAEGEDSRPGAPAEVEVEETTADADRTMEKKKKKKKRKQNVEPSEDAPMPDAEPAEEGNGDDAPEVEPEVDSEPKKKKKSKDKKRRPIFAEEEADQPAEDAEAPIAEKVRKRAKKEKKRDKRKQDETSNHVLSNTDRIDVDELPGKPYPFFTQTVSQYLPLYPQGMIEPVEGYAEQHLKPLVNRYVPTLKGVLLSYRDARIGEKPGQGSLQEQSEMDEEALLESIDEYAVAFSWLTAEVDLFKPSRGAWLEGTINLQSEGHLGVVCWGMFNASIEAARLPSVWRWVDLNAEGSKNNGKLIGKKGGVAGLEDPFGSEDEQEQEVAEEEGDGAEAKAQAHEEGPEDDLSQLHTTGYWVDEQGQKVRGTLQFRVKNYEVGISGDYGYLSIEGTMLDDGAEKTKVLDEMESSRRQKLRNRGFLRGQKTVLPEFSVTKFDKPEEEEEENPEQRAEVWKGSRPASETAE